MSPWKVILATIIIFGTGVLTGGFVSQRGFRTKPPQSQFRPQGDPVPTPFFVRREFLDRLDRHLNLSREQYDRIARILQDSQERTRIIVGLVSPEIQDELRSVREEIRAQLDSEQRKRFEEVQHLLNARPQGPGPRQFPGDGPPRGERRQPPRNPDGNRSGSPAQTRD